MAEKDGSGRSQLSPLPKVTQRRRQSPGKEHKSQSYPLGRLDPGLSPSFEVFQVLDVHQIPVGIRIEFAQGLEVTSSPAAVPL